MRRRLLTALVMCVLLLGALGSGNPWLFGILLGLLLAAGAWEWSGLARLPQRTARVSYALAIIAATVGARIYCWNAACFEALLGVALLFWVLMLLWLLLAPQRINRYLVLAAGFGVLMPAWLALARVAGEWPHGIRWTLLILAVPVAMDTGGYFFGRAFGRHKLAPQVSPGKTWEGVFGGMLLVALLAWFTTGWSAAQPLHYLSLCLGAAAFSVVGDLAESMFKRAAGLKDSGGLFPGHGGALDRMDSIAAAAPIMTLGLIWLGVGT
jgi:phosphatidate cytidylyltransferase